MADITTIFLHEDDIDALGSKYFFLKNVGLENPAFSSWKYQNTHSLGYEDIKNLNVIFIGQTGYGKSSLINKLIGKEIFETSDYKACTKILQSADFFLHHKKQNERIAYQLSFIDLPGIGENDKADKHYLEWYQDYIEEATVIVYLFRADKRDHTQDEFFFKNIFDKQKADNFIYVISQADKIEPINRANILSSAQKENLEKKKLDIKSKSFLNFGKIDIIHISSHLDINIKKLEDKIIAKIKWHLQM